MGGMFNQQPNGKGFNQNINQWNVGSVTNMTQMFYINKDMTYDLNDWDTSKVTTMNLMFYQSNYNGNISNWNTSAVTNMSSMFFQNSTFNKDISSWSFKGISATANLDSFMTSATGFSTVNYNALLIAMNNNKSSAPYRSDLRPTFGATYYGSTSAAATARAALVAYGWTITDGGATSAAPDAPTTVSGTAGNTQVSLTWVAPTYNNGAAISDYTVQYSSNSGSSWTTFSHSASATASITVTGLTNNTAYIFRVAAVNSAGTGSYSTNSSSVTPVAASFTPVAYVITSGTSRSVPTGATSMKAWVIGGGGGGTEGTNCSNSSECDGGYGGEAVKTYTVVGGNTVSYTIGAGGAGGAGGAAVNGVNSTLTYGGVTVTGGGGTRGDSGTCGLPYGTGTGGDFNRSLGASTPYPSDFQGRSAAVTLSGTTLAANVGKGGLGQVMDVGLPGGNGVIVLYFT
jgi:surface protein